MGPNRRQTEPRTWSRMCETEIWQPAWWVAPTTWSHKSWTAFVRLPGASAMPWQALSTRPGPRGSPPSPATPPEAPCRPLQPALPAADPPIHVPQSWPIGHSIFHSAQSNRWRHVPIHQSLFTSTTPKAQSVSVRQKPCASPDARDGVVGVGFAAWGLKSAQRPRPCFTGVHFFCSCESRTTLRRSKV